MPADYLQPPHCNELGCDGRCTGRRDEQPHAPPPSHPAQTGQLQHQQWAAHDSVDLGFILSNCIPPSSEASRQSEPNFCYPSGHADSSPMSLQLPSFQYPSPVVDFPLHSMHYFPTFAQTLKPLPQVRMTSLAPPFVMTPYTSPVMNGPMHLSPIMSELDPLASMSGLPASTISSPFEPQVDFVPHFPPASPAEYGPMAAGSFATAFNPFDSVVESIESSLLNGGQYNSLGDINDAILSNAIQPSQGTASPLDLCSPPAISVENLAASASLGASDIIPQGTGWNPSRADSKLRQPMRPPSSPIPMESPPTPTATPIRRPVSALKAKCKGKTRSKPTATSLPANQLTKKKRRVHMYQCPHPGCPRSFSRAYNLKTHVEIHDPHRDRPFVCDHCQKRFARVHDLVRHARVHGAAKEFGCKTCGKVFSRKDAMRRHIKASEVCQLAADDEGADSSDEREELLEGKMIPSLVKHEAS
ncbi:hypothetical protein DFJ73DRAFT_640994 [Zopfochytrium polystomum]|nr:hypothetical protein DFJ73DRAFT_640994 [Zopfochytrium polystomum]